MATHPPLILYRLGGSIKYMGYQNQENRNRSSGNSDGKREAMREEEMCTFCSVSISLNMGYRLNVRDLNVSRYTVKPFPNRDVSITLILNLD